MLKVCGVTYTHTENYGSCLQAYALQSAIEEANQDKDVSYQLVPMGKLLWRRKVKMSILQHIRRECVMLIRFHYRKSYVGFERQYMRFVNCSSLEALPSLNNEMDAFVCGSDVIWNPIYNKGVNAFYLDFCNKYKFSYAASFGGAQFDIAESAKIREYLSQFDSISVREEQSLKTAQALTGKQISVMVDPVLLLRKEKWNALAETVNTDGKYILLYSIKKQPTIEAFVEKLKEDTGLKVIVSAGNVKTALQYRMLRVHSPQKWLQLIRDAEYVVTNSFHGMVFSIIFHKRFFVPVMGDLEKGFNVRMYNLLSKVGLINRMFNNLPFEIDLSEINYIEVDRVVEELRTEAFKYLKTNIEAAYRRKIISE